MLRLRFVINKCETDEIAGRFSVSCSQLHKWGSSNVLSLIPNIKINFSQYSFLYNNKIYIRLNCKLILSQTLEQILSICVFICISVMFCVYHLDFISNMHFAFIFVQTYRLFGSFREPLFFFFFYFDSSEMLIFHCFLSITLFMQ